MSDAARPVITIDGPTASGKGTVAQRVAAELGFHYLDSGALYRLTALAADQAGQALDDEVALAETAAGMDIAFIAGRPTLNGDDVSAQLRTEFISQAASRVAALPLVRAALLQVQRDFRQPPGLVADGRDMGSVVFPDATLKVFLTASPEERAERRHKQLIQNGLSAKITDVLEELRARDHRDMNRAVAPLRHYPDAQLLTTDGMSPAEAAGQIVSWYRNGVSR